MTILKAWLVDLAKRHKLTADSDYSALQHVIDVLGPLFVSEVFDHYLADQAKQFLKCSDDELLSLKRQNEFAEILSYPYTAIYNADDLEQILKQFLTHLTANKQHLIDTGYPAQYFEPSMWLDWRVGKIYIVKHAKYYPFDSRIGGDYPWNRTDPDENKVYPCAYKDADFLNCFSFLDARRLEGLRESIYELYNDVLSLLYKSIASRDSSDLYQGCLESISRLKSDDIDFLLKIDKVCYDEEILPLWHSTACEESGSSAPPCSGGITDLLQLIGYVEALLSPKESPGGYLTSIRNRLGKEFAGNFNSRTFYDGLFHNGKLRVSYWNSFSELLDEYNTAASLLADYMNSFFERIGNDLSCEPPLTASPIAGMKIDLSAESKTKLLVYEDERRIVYGEDEFCLPVKQYWAFRFILDRQYLGRPDLNKNNVYKFCEAPDWAYKYSVRKWFIRSGGVSKRLAHRGLLVSCHDGSCRIPVSSEYVEFAHPFSDEFEAD